MSTDSTPNLILGSGSKTRKDILSDMGFSTTIIKPDIDERSIGDRSAGTAKAADLVLLLGNAKADAVLSVLTSEHKNSILVTADQVVVCEGQILEKPKDADEVRSFIQGYGVNPCGTIGSIVLTDVRTGIRVEGVDSTTIHFRPIPDDVVERLIEEGDVYYCAGGLMIENPLVAPYIMSVDGSMESVMGLSKELMTSLLANLQERVKEIEI